ncbi:glycosyltransferase family 2 protein [Salinibacter ruber]|uniref:glycosyltransferase family 2 protein n=1 Tax=Salinibacter ruber TaxID=146919 RepID=UPI002168CF96|nr:glycosyltransferase family 2 protein [Salinibacter ruber]MCS4054124.1 glycosyltransferase involved in cell wall biosynthesis [Salinibacter ruber]
MQSPTLDDLPPPPSGTVGWPWTEETEPANSLASGATWPTISMVTVSYNQGQYLEKTIRSVLLQGYPDLEYIVIDGGSDDESLDIIRKYESWLAYWVSEADRGQTHALNKGLKRCTGDVFNWVNSDDYLAQNALQTVGRHMSDSSVHVLCGYARQFEDETGETAAHVQLRLKDSLEKSVVQHHFRQLPTYYRLDVLRRTGPLNERLNFIMDSELWVRYLLDQGASRVQFTDELLGHFRLHDVSKTVSNSEAFREEDYSLLRQLYRGAFDTLPAPCCEPATERERALDGVTYDTSHLDQRRLKGYLLQFFALYCRERISNIALWRLVGRALVEHPARRATEYRFIVGTILFPDLHRWYQSLFA